MKSLGLLALLAQSSAEGVDVASSSGQSVTELILHANGVVQLTLLLLIAFSVISWAIIGSKHRQLKRSKSHSNNFFDQFHESKTIEDMISKKKFRKSPAFSVFKSSVDALRNKSNDYIRIEREVKRSVDEEIEQMEYGVSFLATTASAAPFIGLFGTVWGILNAFWKIGQTGTSSLAVVGPHIAEALIATAIGLAAAIPAVIFYNVFVNKIRLTSKHLQEFAEDLMLRVKQEYFHS